MANNYCGNREAFVYVYLAKADEAAGRALVDALSGAGHKLYVSSDFTAKDARVLKKAAAAVLMMSSATLDELSPVVTAVTKADKPLIPVYLDELTLPAGMRMLLGPKQAHARNAFADAADFAEALPHSPVLQNLSVSLDGTAWTEGVEYSYDADTGAFATLPGALSVPAAGFAQDPDTGAWVVTPGSCVLTVTGTV